MTHIPNALNWQKNHQVEPARASRIPDHCNRKKKRTPLATLSIARLAAQLKDRHHGSGIVELAAIIWRREKCDLCTQCGELRSSLAAERKADPQRYVKLDKTWFNQKRLDTHISFWDLYFQKE